jgi:hypothetical protein
MSISNAEWGRRLITGGNDAGIAWTPSVAGLRPLADGPQLPRHELSLPLWIERNREDRAALIANES